MVAERLDTPGFPSDQRLSRRAALVLGSAGIALGALAVAGLPAVGRAGQATADPVGQDVAGLVDIGGRSLFMESRGAGGPTVVLEAGAGNNGEIWDTVALPTGTAETAVLPGVAAFTQVCAYDRPGTVVAADRRSRSDPLPMPRSVADMVDDLHALLTAAAVPGPYVLVGHSFGGLIVRLFAMRYPDEVAGLVLVDAAHEDYYASMQSILTPEQWAASRERPLELADYGAFEQIDTDASAAQMRDAVATSPLPPVPLIVVTHGRPWEFPAGYPVDELEAAWRPLQDELVALVPGARLVVAEQSQHYVQIDEPGLVIEAIRQVVDAVRNPETWATPAATGMGGLGS